MLGEKYTNMNGKTADEILRAFRVNHGAIVNVLACVPRAVHGTRVVQCAIPVGTCLDVSYFEEAKLGFLVGNNNTNCLEFSGKIFQNQTYYVLIMTKLIMSRLSIFGLMFYVLTMEV